MGLITNAAWALRQRPEAWGLHEPPVDIAGDEARPGMPVRLWGRRCGIMLRAQKDKRHKVKQKAAKKWEWELKNPGTLTIEEADFLRFPDGSEFRPEFGLTIATLYLDKATAEPWVDFDLDIPAGTKLAYQPALSQAERDGNEARGPAHRPDWAVGSFAVFLGAAKIAHIPRPFAIDADGNWTWGAWERPLPGVLRKVFNPAWLAGAKYPVAVDATMGHTSIGASSGPDTADYVVVYNIGGGAGTATSASLYCYNNPARPLTLGLYKCDGTLCADTAGANSPTSAAWATQNLDASFTLVNGDAYMAAHDHDDGNLTTYYDTDANALWAAAYGASAYSAGALLSPAPNMTYNSIQYRTSIYVTFTEIVAGGGLLQANLRGNMQ